MPARSFLAVLIFGSVVAIACSDNPSATAPAVLWDGIDIGTSGPTCTGGGNETLRAAPQDGSAALMANMVATFNCNAEVDLVCSPHGNLQWGDGIFCEVVVEPFGFPFTVRKWSFEGFKNGNFASYHPGPEWAGPMIESGVIRVEVDIDGGTTPLIHFVTVYGRSPLSWSNRISGGQGSPGQIDSCFQGNEVGLTASVNCTQSTAGFLFTPATPTSNFHSPYVISHGPNQGLYYVGNPIVDMDLKTQILRDFRADGGVQSISSTSSVQAVVTGCQSYYGNLNARSIFQVNTNCVPNSGFGSMTTSIWAHEGKHLSAAMAAANSSEGDLHRLLGPLTSRSASQLWAAAKLEFENAHDYIKGQANNHNGTFSTFWFYMPSPAPSWLYSSIPLENN